MAKTVINWSMKKLVWMIVQILQNKFDCVIIVEGNRGLGKSTLAIHLTRGVTREFKKLGIDKYKFNWRSSFIYTKKETKQFFHKWDASGIADEMINVTFNRDFYDEDQKDIIKMINMNRDHRNLFVACVPQFQTLDNQIKNLCKLRITVVRRGIAVVQTPNRTIYVKDKWDTASNEKIERAWIQKGIKNPHYTKLTTFRGLLKFPKLTDQQEEKYQRTKDLKRNIVAREEMGIDDEEEQKDPHQIVIEMLKEGKVKNGTFIDGFAIAHGYKPQTFQNGLRNKLKEQGLNSQISSYYWEKKSRQKEKSNFDKREEDLNTIASLKEKLKV